MRVRPAGTFLFFLDLWLPAVDSIYHTHVMQSVVVSTLCKTAKKCQTIAVILQLLLYILQTSTRGQMSGYLGIAVRSLLTVLYNWAFDSSAGWITTASSAPKLSQYSTCLYAGWQSYTNREREARRKSRNRECIREKTGEVFSVFIGELFSGEAAGEVWGSSEDGHAVEIVGGGHCGYPERHS